VRDQVGGVGGDAFIEAVEVLTDGTPREVEIDRIAVPPGDLLTKHGQRGIVDRGIGEPVLSEELGGDALTDLCQMIGVEQDLQVRMGVHVDESRRQDQSIRLNDPVSGWLMGAGGIGDNVSDSGTVDEDIGGVARVFGPVDDGGRPDEGAHG
jgi:hypothetical protein